MQTFQNIYILTVKENILYKRKTFKLKMYILLYFILNIFISLFLSSPQLKREVSWTLSVPTWGPTEPPAAKWDHQGGREHTNTPVTKFQVKLREKSRNNKLLLSSYHLTCFFPQYSVLSFLLKLVFFLAQLELVLYILIALNSSLQLHLEVPRSKFI